MSELLTTLQAARLTGVGPSSLKRWADQGVLPCIRTAGGHRRFERAAVQAFVRSLAAGAAGEDVFLGAWIDRLVQARRHEVDGALLEARARLGAWHRVADEMGAVVTEIGRRWENGQLTIAEEHVAADCLGRALVRVAEALPGRTEGPRCVLACAEDDDHTLGLSFAELCLRELGWVPLWLGRRTPSAEIVRIVDNGLAQMVAISASSASGDARSLKAYARSMGTACRKRGVTLVLGGAAPWPDPPGYGLRFKSFGDFHAHVARANGGPL